MQATIAHLEFTKTLGIRVVFPGNLTSREIARIAETQDVDLWDAPEWSTDIIDVRFIDLPPEQCQMEKAEASRFLVPGVPLLREPDVYVFDAHEGFVDARDAAWWQLTPEQMEEERMRARRLQDIHHPDQMTLPLAGKEQPNGR
jgi:hypothetical protein